MNLFSTVGLSGTQGVLSVLYIITILFICLLIVFQNRSPVKTLSWVMVILLIPLAGILIYFLFGQEYRKRKIFSRKGLADLNTLARDASLQISSIDKLLEAESEAVRSKSHLISLMLNNNKSILTSNNKVDILLNGEETFPAMFESVRNATSFVHMQFYRFDFDELAQELIEVLMEKASSGIEVRIIFDDVGSWNFPNHTVKRMRSAGIQIFPFMPVRFPFLTSKINYRNHRKILVVDGDHAYIGGLNIARKYLKGDKELGKWRDTHFRITGEAVSALNTIFLTDWFFVSGIVLSNIDFQPVTVAESDIDKCLVQIASSGPDSDWANIMQVFFSAIATARNSIAISTPYFSPDESLLTALKTASLSGVDVRLLLPARSDSAIATWNTRSYISELTEAGVKVFLYARGFNHSKYMIVDNLFSVIGSANVDMRSFDLNFEVTALVYDNDFGAGMTEVFRKDLSASVQVDSESWSRRKKLWRYRESLARILGPLY